MDIGKFGQKDKLTLGGEYHVKEKYFKEYSYDKSIEISNGGM